METHNEGGKRLTKVYCGKWLLKQCVCVCVQTASRFSESSGVLSPPIGFTVSAEPYPSYRQSSTEPVLATPGAQVLASVSCFNISVVVYVDTTQPFTALIAGSLVTGRAFGV